jgi:hypothetical protein
MFRYRHIPASATGEVPYIIQHAGGATMAQPVENFIRKTGVTAGIFNLVLNPFFAWLGNMEMADVPLVGAAAVDTAITCMVMSLLVSLFISADTRRAIRAGSLETAGMPLRGERLLCRLPVRPWKLGLLLGLAVAVVVTPWLVGLFGIFGVASFSFFAFAALKAVYTPIVAHAVARWVILRQLEAATRVCDSPNA